MLKAEDLSQNFKPELVQNLMQALEESQRQVEELRKSLWRRAVVSPRSLLKVSLCTGFAPMLCARVDT